MKTAEDMRQIQKHSVIKLGVIESFFIERTLKRVMKDLERAARRNESTIRVKYKIDNRVEQFLKSKGYDILFTQYDHTYHITFSKNGFKPTVVRVMKI